MDAIPNDRIVEALKAAGLDAELWSTGGGSEAVVVVLRRAAPVPYRVPGQRHGVLVVQAQADRWLMFHPTEPVVGLYDEHEGHLAGPHSGEPIREWNLSDVRTLAALVARTREIVAEAVGGAPT